MIEFGTSKASQKIIPSLWKTIEEARDHTNSSCDVKTARLKRQKCFSCIILKNLLNLNENVQTQNTQLKRRYKEKDHVFERKST